MTIGERTDLDLTHPAHPDGGGEAPCCAHLLADTDDDADAQRAVLVHLDEIATDPDAQGAVWHVPHGGDLDANLVRFDAGCGVGEHVNDEVDVVIVVQRGDGLVQVGRRAWPVQPAMLLMIPRGLTRAISAGADGIEYLSIHRRRSGLRIR